MTSLAYDFDNQADLDDALAHLWDRLGIGGEVGVRPLPEGGFRMEMLTEKNLRPASLEKIRGRRVEE